MNDQIFNGVPMQILSASEIAAALSRHVGEGTPSGAVTESYQMFRNTKNGLEYAEPRVPGNAELYQWLGGFSWYYPKCRWEFQRLIEVIQRQVQERGGCKVVDVGCGSGKFLKLVAEQKGVEHLGLEPSELACKGCREIGLNVFHGLTEDFLRDHQHERFDIVCSFHTLEHVADPVQFVGDLVKLAKPGGLVCISTPLSPMFFECVWFDVLNHPPHHLTRWTLDAYRDLAAAHALDAKFEFPKPTSILRQIWFVCELVNFGPSRGVSSWRRLRTCIMHPFSTLTIAFKLVRQRCLRRESKWDSVLVLLSSKRCQS